MNSKVQFAGRIAKDLEDSGINLKIITLFVPVAFLTFLFHEFGHWIVGEALGNNMVISLNNSNALSGQYAGKNDHLWISMGGPAFSLLQAVVFLIVIELTRSSYAYPFLFFAGFSRFFSIIFGGFSAQDEARISSLLHTGPYCAAAIVMLLMVAMIWRSSFILKLNLKAIGYYSTLGTLGMILVIGVNRLVIQ